MPSRNSTLLMIAIALTWALTAFQGNRIESIRKSEAFYRWALSAASLTRLDETLEPDKSESVAEAMDDELFARLVEVAESELPDYEVDLEQDVDSEGNPTSKLVRAVRQSQDKDLWRFVNSSTTSDIRKDFLKYLRSRQIQSLGTQFGASSLYDESTQAEGVGIAGLFFGFRKVAANLLWIQVDSHWHSGQMHRMVPLMRTTVALDPAFVDAYLLGAWHLAYNIPARIEPTPEPLKKIVPGYHKPIGLREEWFLLGAEFLRDGIRKNPRDYRLYFDLGFGIYAQKLEDHPNAILYLDEARRHKHDRWVPRMLFGSLQANGQYEDAIEGWESYIVDFGETEVTNRKILENKGFMAEAIADEGRECEDLIQASIDEWTDKLSAGATGAEADELNANIESAQKKLIEIEAIIQEELKNAHDIWTGLYDRFDDPLARGRLAIRAAKELVEEGRYIEAVAELDIIRFEDFSNFDEASDLIIEIKQEAGMPLAVSEQRQVIRQQDVERLNRQVEKQKRIQRIDCGYEHG